MGSVYSILGILGAIYVYANHCSSGTSNGSNALKVDPSQGNNTAVANNMASGAKLLLFICFT
jgi:hypothetical protein